MGLSMSGLQSAEHVWDVTSTTGDVTMVELLVSGAPLAKGKMANLGRSAGTA